MLSESSTASENEEIVTPLLDDYRHRTDASLPEKTMIQQEYHNEPLTLIEIFAAELLGTALLMFFGCMGLFADPSKFEILAPMQGGLVFGFVVASVIAAISHISDAHLNPAVSLCSYLLGKITFISAVVYIVAEVIGAVLGFWLLKESVPQHLFSAYVNASCGFCNTIPGPGVSITQAFTLEFLATSFLIFIVCGIWDSRNAHNTDSVAIKFALFIAAASIAVGPFTGAGLNPARSFAPALVNNIWKNHWIYWLAPLSGSIVTTLFYKRTFMKKDQPKTCHNEDKHHIMNGLNSQP